MAGQRVVTTPSRRPRSTQMLTVPPRKDHPRDRQAEARLDEREVGQDVPGEDLVHQHQVVERGRPGMAADDPAGVQGYVVDHLTLRGLGPADRAAADGLAGDPGKIRGPFGQIFGDLPEQTERLVHLVPANPQPGQRVTGGVAADRRHGQRQVPVVGTGEPGVVGVPGGLADRAERSVLARALRRQRACAAQPVQERGGGHQRGRVGGNRAAELVDLGEDLGGRQPRRRADPAGHHHPAAEPAAAQPADQPQHPLLMQGEPGGGHREPGRVGQLDGDVEVVGDPLELGVQHPDQGRGRRRLHNPRLSRPRG